MDFLFIKYRENYRHLTHASSSISNNNNCDVNTCQKKKIKKIWMMKSFLLTWNNNNTWSINFTVGKSIFGHSSGQDQDKWNFLDFHQALLASPKRKKTRRDVFFY